MDMLELYHSFVCLFHAFFKRAQWPPFLSPEVGNCTFYSCKGELFSAFICLFSASTSFTSLAALIVYRFMFLISLCHFGITSIYTEFRVKNKNLEIISCFCTDRALLSEHYFYEMKSEFIVYCE